MGPASTKSQVQKQLAHVQVVVILQMNFTRLRSAGGFLLMMAKTGGYNQPLKELDILYYTAKNIGRNSRNSIIYIRPLQRNFDMSPMTSNEVNYSFNILLN